MFESREHLEVGARPYGAPNAAGLQGVQIPATHRIDANGRIRLDDIPQASFAQEAVWYPQASGSANTTTHITLPVPSSFFWRTLYFAFPAVTATTSGRAYTTGKLIGKLQGRSVYEQSFGFDTAGNTVSESAGFRDTSGLCPGFKLQGSMAATTDGNISNALHLDVPVAADCLIYPLFTALTAGNFIGQAVLFPFRVCLAMDAFSVETSNYQITAGAVAGFMLACRSQNTPH